MKKTAPHFLLFTQANSYSSGGRWKFVLEQIGSDFRIVESDDEPDVRGERLHLLAVIRGLESLDQPSQVTLITPSRGVGQGIRSGLKFWRQHDWMVESDGAMKPLRHADMWQRIDVALKYHQISCRVWHFDAPQASIQHEPKAPENTSPFVSPFASTEKPSSSRWSNRIRIDDEVRQAAFGSCNPQMTSASNILVQRVKPIGHGRAYGYAVN